jgi:hypothetical protein
MARQWRKTELGDEVQCANCKEFWPADSEFYFMRPGKIPHSWCKDCYVNNPKQIAKVQRALAAAKAKRSEMRI